MQQHELFANLDNEELEANEVILQDRPNALVHDDPNECQLCKFAYEHPERQLKCPKHNKLKPNYQKTTKKYLWKCEECGYVSNLLETADDGGECRKCHSNLGRWLDNPIKKLRGDE